jgi:23S rRNA (adenine2503-C2)-methyltransferase
MNSLRSGRIDLPGLTRGELEEFVTGLGEPSFRADQIFQWLWQKGARDFAEMSNLSREFRGLLAECCRIGRPEVRETRVGEDGTVKFLLGLDDGELVETVLIPEKDHRTLCLSSQVGCAMACTFCRTGRMGFRRDMGMAEILGQVLVAREYLEERGEAGSLRNLVFMGMGEPLLNTSELLKSLDVLADDKGLGFSARRMTVSSVGVKSGLEQLGEHGGAALAVSLHAPDQELRERIMPRAARSLPLDRLMESLDAYPLRPRQRITYEYILLKGINDGPAQARGLVRLLGQRKAKVNLIAFNEAPGIPYEAPELEAVEAFAGTLRGRGLTAMIRKSKGLDIKAACGQLKAERLKEAQ